MKVHVQALNQDSVGKVSRFADALDPQTRTMETEIDFDNKAGKLLPGMYAETVLQLAESQNALVVPLEAVAQGEKGAAVLVVNAQERGRGAESEVGSTGKIKSTGSFRIDRRRASDCWQPQRIPKRRKGRASGSQIATIANGRGKLMAGFSIRNPFFIIVCCLIIAIVGTVTLVRMPVDLFPPINIPVVVVATFYSGMPPQQIEASITNPFERFFTLASGVDHIESRSLPGVSLVKMYFQPGTNADSDVSTIANLAMAQLRRLPQGTLPPVVLKFDASSLPVCLVTLKGQGLNETELHDLGQFNVRNQIANVPGASVPQPFGGKYRQIMVYVDPVEARGAPIEPHGCGSADQ